MNKIAYFKLFLLIAITILILSFNWWGAKVGLSLDFPDGTSLRAWFSELGTWGPATVIASMIVAILVSPIPSAPIALAAGAIYGHIWGTLYVLTGAEIGAITAFCISRFLGQDLLRKWFGEKLGRSLVGSQNFLMASVFASRLMPFISFDIVSYAAGLTPLSFWRFALATFAGIIPASFVLAHVGSEMVADETDRMLTAVAVLGALTALPFIVRYFTKSQRN